MVGNAVPPRLAKFLALSIKKALVSVEERKAETINVLVAYYKDNNQLRQTLKTNFIMCVPDCAVERYKSP